MHALVTSGEKDPAGADDMLGQALHGDAEPLRHLGGRARHVQDAVALEVRPVRHAPEGERRLRRLCVGDQRVNLLGGPHEELALHAFRVRILGGKEAARGMRHLAQDVVERLLGDPPVLVITGGEPGVEIAARELGVVVEHLLEVRHQPLGVHRVAVKAPPDWSYMPPRAIAGQRERTMSSARGFLPRLQKRSTESQIMGWGTWGRRTFRPAARRSAGTLPETR